MADSPAESEGDLTAVQVADILGVQRQTVYAYVSRGLLSRRVDLDGRTSRFDRAEVEQLRLGRRGEREGELRTVLTTRITRVADDGLWIRGVDLPRLVRGGAGFRDVVELTWEGRPGEEWPDPAEVDHGQSSISPQPSSLLEVLAVTVAVQAAADPLRHDLNPPAVRAAGRRAITAMTNALARAGGPTSSRAGGPTSSRAGGPTSSLAGGPITARLWRGLTFEADSRPGDERAGEALRPERLRALDVALALLVDHGLAASTFAARIAASVRADPYSVIASGLGPLSGPLHGAASAAVHEVYQRVEQQGLAEAVGSLQRRGAEVPGFGHAVYRRQDPRYGVLMEHLIDGWRDDPRLATVYRLRDLMGERGGPMPNIDLALGALTYLADMAPEAGEVIFAVARSAGWLAHALEEYDERPLRFRPTARYIGRKPPAR